MRPAVRALHSTAVWTKSTTLPTCSTRLEVNGCVDIKYDVADGQEARLCCKLFRAPPERVPGIDRPPECALNKAGRPFKPSLHEANRLMRL